VIGIDPQLCTGCGKCVQVCPTRAMSLSHRKARIDSDRCVMCLQCMSVCPTNAIQHTPETIRALRLRLHQLGWKVHMLSLAVIRAGQRLDTS
jgi:ferredoxin